MLNQEPFDVIIELKVESVRRLCANDEDLH